MALLLWQIASIILGSEVLVTVVIMVVLWRSCKWTKRPSSHSSEIDKKSLHPIADDIILEDLFSSDAGVEIGAPPSNHGSFRMLYGKSKLSNGLSPMPSLRESPKADTPEKSVHPIPLILLRNTPLGRSPRVSPEHTPPKEPQEVVGSPVLVSQEYPKTHPGMFIPLHYRKVSPAPIRKPNNISPSWSAVHESSIDISLSEPSSRTSTAPYFRPSAIGESTKSSPVQNEKGNSTATSLRETLRIEYPTGSEDRTFGKRTPSMRRPTMGEESHTYDVLDYSYEDLDDRGPGRVRFEPLWKGKSDDILPNMDVDGTFKYIKDINT